MNERIIARIWTASHRVQRVRQCNSRITVWPVTDYGIYYLDGTADPEEERMRYTALLEQYPVDIVCAGIGENGHLAFNDPPWALLAPIV